MSSPKRVVAVSAVDALREATEEFTEAELRRLRQHVKVLKGELGKALNLKTELCDAARVLPPTVPWKPPTGRNKKAPVSLLAMLGDIHCGEVTSVVETCGWGKYNSAIAEDRLRRYADHIIRYASTQRGGYNIDVCHVVLVGDMISGDIHEELLRTNEFPTPEQAIRAGRMVANFVRAMAGHFVSVVVHAIGGSNHSRISKKYQFKEGVLNSFDHLSYAFAGALLAQQKNVTFNEGGSKKEKIEIEGYKFLVTHGDNIKGWLGIPFYGFEREAGREARRHLQQLMDDLRKAKKALGGFDYILAGHFHSPMVGPNTAYVLNGSVGGTNELDHALGRHAEPQQVTALVSRNHGLFSPIFWRLDT